MILQVGVAGEGAGKGQQTPEDKPTSERGEGKAERAKPSGFQACSRGQEEDAQPGIVISALLQVALLVTMGFCMGACMGNVIGNGEKKQIPECHPVILQGLTQRLSQSSRGTGLGPAPSKLSCSNLQASVSPRTSQGTDTTCLHTVLWVPSLPAASVLGFDGDGSRDSSGAAVGGE